MCICVSGVYFRVRAEVNFLPVIVLDKPDGARRGVDESLRLLCASECVRVVIGGDFGGSVMYVRARANTQDDLEG